MDVTITELREKHPGRFDEELEDYSSDVMSDNYWSHCVIDDWIEKLDKLGVDCTRDGVNWSGFWCQGDGASFTGRVSMRKFWEAHGAPADYLVAAEFLRNGEVFEYCEIIRRDHHYCHENTVGVDDTPALWTVPGLDGQLEEGVFAGARVQDLMEQAEEQMNNLCAWIEETCRGYMREIYSDLEEEYDHQCSEESFIEHCIANDRTFEIEGDEDESDC